MSADHKGWDGVDLDGTLAFYDKWRGYEHIGDPVPRMHLRVLWMLQDGVDVRIFTARVSPMACQANGITPEQARAPIEAWCLKFLGKVLPITHEKDLAMVRLWDDRAVQIIPNTGERADGKE